MMSRFIFAFVLLWIPFLAVSAHGVDLDHTIDAETGAVTITAAFDTGDIMDEAQVAIFAPDNLIEPYETGVTDEAGTYVFQPDYDIEGTWDVQVRQAGHGGLIRVSITSNMRPDTETDASPQAQTLYLDNDTAITIAGDAATMMVDGAWVIAPSAAGLAQFNQSDVAATLTDDGNDFTTQQILIMSISVVWGFIGTALYFMRRNRKSEEFN